MNFAKEKKVDLFNYIVWIAIQIIVWNLPASGGLTKEGVHTLAVFAGLLYGLCFIKQYAIPCLIAPVLMAYTGAVPDGVVASFMSGFGSNPFAMMFSVLMIAGIVNKSGMAKKLALYMINSKLTRGKPWTLTFIILFTTTILAVFIHPAVVIAIMLELVVDIFRGLDLKMNRWTVFMLLDITVCGIQAQNVMPFQQATPLLYAIAGTIDPNITVLRYGMPNLALNGLITIAVLIICFLLTFLFCRNDVEDVKKYVPKEVEPLNEEQKITGVILIIFVIAQLVPHFLPASAVKEFLISPDLVGFCAIFVSIAMIVRKKDGSRFITFEDIASNGFMWFPLMMLVGLGPCISAMTSDVTGVMPWLTNIVKPICENLSPFGVLVFLCAFCAIATNIIDNMPVFFIVIPIVCVICKSIGMNAAAALSALLPCIQIGVLLPGATPYAAMMFGKTNTGYATFAKLSKWSLVRTLIVFLCSITIGWGMMAIFPPV